MTAERPNFAFAKRNGATLRGWLGETADVVVRRGAKPAVLAELKRHLNAPLKLTTVEPDEFDALLQRLYEAGNEDARQMAQDIGEDVNLSQIADQLAEPEDLMEADDDAPIIRLINALLTEAVKDGASDIHIEPLESRLMVRFRVDGLLREVLTPARHLANPIVSRIKVMSRLDIAEKRLPQDGRISLKVAGRPVDVRVSTIPSGHGERVVLRLLDKQAGKLGLNQLGMSPAVGSAVDEIIHRPHGIMLVTGPTGSGKTTTLYGALERLNDRSRNIMTVEDPIEYFLDGIGQTQVNTKVDMSFARGLRAILRQDPDVVMVGEIRDLETAQIAIQASLTGHLVLSTLHTNTAAGAITRLNDMGIESFLLSSSLLGVLAQRLIRRLNPAHRVGSMPTAAELQAFGLDAADARPIYRAPTDLPHAQAFQGRTGIYELLTIDEAARALIHDGVSEAELDRLITPDHRMINDGWQKVLQGHTTPDEVLRVTRKG